MAATARHTDTALSLGPRIKTLRQARGMSLRDLAQRSDVSAPMLSQVERGETSPTISLAAKIARGLAMTLSQLLRLDEGAFVDVVRAGERPERRAGGHAYRNLTPELPGQRASVTMHSLASRARTGGDGNAPPVHEPGSRETIVVTSGAIALDLDDARYELSEGDAVTFDADLPHSISNPGRATARFVAVVTAGLRTT